MATYIVRVLDRDGELRGVVSEIATGSAHTFTDGTSLLEALAGHHGPEHDGRPSLHPVEPERLPPTSESDQTLSGQADSGPFESLTASQRRVCELAMLGKSNLTIAQELFITRGTVESHLHASYRKLGIESRFELPVAFLERVA